MGKNHFLPSRKHLTSHSGNQQGPKHTFDLIADFKSIYVWQRNNTCIICDRVAIKEIPVVQIFSLPVFRLFTHRKQRACVVFVAPTWVTGAFPFA